MGAASTSAAIRRSSSTSRSKSRQRAPSTSSSSSWCASRCSIVAKRGSCVHATSSAPHRFPKNFSDGHVITIPRPSRHVYTPDGEKYWLRFPVRGVTSPVRK
jgi:hypothetical protein